MQEENYLKQVRDQYEDYPYPYRDPKKELDNLLVTAIDDLDQINHYCYEGKQNFKENYRILIAGGGTGDAAVYLAEQLKHTNAHIIYLDMSQASMHIAQQRAQARGLTNIEWIHDSILNIPNLGFEPFDYINSSGVLHHLENPEEGLQILGHILKDDGCMGLMLYAPYGRTGVYQMQALMRLVNEDTTSAQQKVDRCKALLPFLPKSHSFKAEQFPDISQYGDIGIYDLLLHSQDRAYSILELYDYLATANLTPAQFLSHNTPMGNLLYHPAAYIRDPALLKEIEKLEVPKQQAIAELMNGNIRKHVFYAAKTPRKAVSYEDWNTIPALAKDLPDGTQHAIASIIEQSTGDIASMNMQPFNYAIHIKKGPYTLDIFKHIDGKRTIQDIFTLMEADKAIFTQDLASLLSPLINQNKLFLKATAS